MVPLITLAQLQDAKLPYSESKKKTQLHRIKTERELVVRIIDDIGYDYYRLTDSLFLSHEEKKSYVSNLPRLLSYVVYQMSVVLVNTERRNSTIYPFESMSYDAIRKSSLKNLELASNFYKRKKKIRNADITQALIPISVIQDYLTEFRNFRTRLGLPLPADNSEQLKEKKRSTLYEQSIDADGLTTEQWIALNRYDSEIRGQYWNLYRAIRRRNFRRLNEIIKQEKIRVRAGDPEPLKEYTGVVEDIEYRYFRQRPKRVSFLFSSDEELLEQLINWIIFINSGNETKLSEIFTMGLGVATSQENQSVRLSFDYIKNRTVMDRKNNTVLLKYSDLFFDGVQFKDVLIDKVYITKTNSIVFAVKTGEGMDPDIAIQLINGNGDLMNRIKTLIDFMRTNENDYNSKSLNLFKF